jgi:phage-related minor tail protein
VDFSFRGLDFSKQLDAILSQNVLRGIGSSVLQQVLDTLVQIGVQQVVNGNAAKAIAIGWKALTSGLRAADTAETVAAESAKAPLLAANAAAASASSFGLSAVIGIAALAAVLGAFVAGFEDGGFTGPGGRSEVAGVVHRGEYVFSAPSVQALGLDRLDSLHRAGRGYAQGGFVNDLGSRMAGRGRGEMPAINLVAVDSRREAEAIRKNSRGEAQVFDLIKRRRHELLG